MRPDRADHPGDIKFPEPVISISVEPKTKVDQDKMDNALVRLAEEDPTFQVRTDHDTGQTLISGMGELHLEVIVDRMLREFKVEANVGRPQVAYRETMTPAGAQLAGRFKRQTGGRGQYGDAVIDLEPLRRGEGFEFVNKIMGGSIPTEYHPGRRARVSRRRWRRGVKAGYPMVDMRVTLVDGSYHEVDSSEDGLQDRRLDGAAGGLAEGQARPARADHEASRSSRPSSSWAT